MTRNFLIMLHVNTSSGSNWIEVFKGEALSFPSMLLKVDDLMEDWRFILNNGKPKVPNNEFIITLLSMQEVPHMIVDCNNLDFKRSEIAYERELLEQKLS